jgi:hypothetical protein
VQQLGLDAHHILSFSAVGGARRTSWPISRIQHSLGTFSNSHPQTAGPRHTLDTESLTWHYPCSAACLMASSVAVMFRACSLRRSAMMLSSRSGAFAIASFNPDGPGPMTAR